jgi:hypothetical protein
MRYRHRRGEQSLIGADLMDFNLVGPRQPIQTAIRGVHNAESILARLNFEIRKDLAVDQRNLTSDLRNPRGRITQLAIAPQVAIKEHERNLVLAIGQP